MTIFFFLQEYKNLSFYYSGVFSEQSVLGNNHLAVVDNEKANSDAVNQTVFQ